MSNLEKFLAKSVEIEVGGEKYNLKPLTVNDLPALQKSRNSDPKIAAEGATEVAFLAFKQICPDATMEQFKNVDIKLVDELMLGVAKANGHDIEDAKKKLLEQNAKSTE